MSDTFPIQSGNDKERPFDWFPGTVIPWWLAEIAYAEYSRRWGTNQSLERLAERGGFGRYELVQLLRGEEGDL